tara:strand:+ start:468 stop:731 length:264 start_codon:yes stop_codon:yes gene_type:complete
MYTGMLYKMFLLLFKKIARPRKTSDTIIIEDSIDKALLLFRKVNKIVNNKTNTVMTNFMCVREYNHFSIVFSCFDGDLILKFLYNNL